MNSILLDETENTPSQYNIMLNNVVMNPKRCETDFYNISKKIQQDNDNILTNTNKLQKLIKTAEMKSNNTFTKIVTSVNDKSGTDISIENSKELYNEKYCLNIIIIVGTILAAVIIFKMNKS